jgi:anti-sigma regulatory factor (Ser/Thr protein kinase)
MIGPADSLTMSVPRPNALRAVLDLSALATAPSCARAWTREMLWEWRVSPDLTSIAELIVSELTTNSVQACRCLSLPVIRLILVFDQVRPPAETARLVVEVWDEAPGTPVRRDTDGLDEFGRGLPLVDALATQWGWHREEGDRQLKCVWTELRPEPVPVQRSPEPSKHADQPDPWR